MRNWPASRHRSRRINSGQRSHAPHLSHLRHSRHFSGSAAPVCVTTPGACVIDWRFASQAAKGNRTALHGIASVQTRRGADDADDANAGGAGQ